MELTDQTLADAITRAKQLDPAALGQVYDAYFPRIYCYTRFRLGEAARAHEFSVQVFNHWLDTLAKRPKQIDQHDCWLFETARKFIDQDLSLASRRNIANPTLPAGVEPSNAETQAAWLNLLVRKSLGKLLPEQQHLLALRFGVPMSLEETSRIAGRSMAEVKGIQFEALQSLRGWLEKEV